MPGKRRLVGTQIPLLAGLCAVAVLFGACAGSSVDEAATAGRRAHIPALAADGPPPPPPPVYYTVAAGDNLYSIAMRFGTTSVEIARLNGLANRNAISAGQVLVVLPRGPAPPPPSPPSSAATIRRGPALPMVAFSFDAGSDVGYSALILETLAANGITATFGMTGNWARANPDMLRRIAAEGHQIINHTFTHTDLRDLGSAARASELEKTDALIVSLTGIGTRPFFRPPFGGYNASVLADVAAGGYGYNLMWTVDSLGWNGLSASQIVARCLDGLVPGGIYLFHVGIQSLDGPALQALIDAIRARGYTIGSIADLLGH